MARPFISRLLETFFRRKWLYLLPLVPFIALGVLTVVRTGPTYRSTGVVKVNLNTTLDQVNQSDTALSGETVATYTARQINTLLGTDEFLDMVMTTAGIPRSDAADASVRRAVWAAAEGDDLVTVNAATSLNQTSFDLADATIKSYPQYLINDAKQDSENARLALDGIVRPLKEAHDNAQAAYDDLARTVNVPDDQVPASLRSELNTRQALVDSTLEELNKAQEDLNKAQLTNQQSETRIRQQFRTIDEPKVPGAPEPRRKQDVMTIGLFTILGLLVSGAALVIGTLMDRSVRFSDEIETHLDVPVVATIPDSRAAVRPRIL